MPNNSYRWQPLAAVREEKLLAQLPPEEQAQWRLFWAKVRALRDRTAPGK
jgi:hypothetical protein